MKQVMLLPLAKGHTSNKDSILWQKGLSLFMLLEVDYCT